MQTSYSASQWSALLAFRVLMGCYLLYLGLGALGVLGWDEPRQIPTGSLLLHYLEAADPAPRFVAAAESVHATVLTALGCALVLGFFERAVCMLSLLLLSSATVLEVPLFTDAPVFAKLMFVSEQVAAVIAVAVLLVFPTSGVLGLDALRLHTGEAPAPLPLVPDEPVMPDESAHEQEAVVATRPARTGTGRPHRLRVAAGESS